jgi:predicted phage tail protein
MKVVKVYGALRKKLGQCRFQFDVDTPAQALKALCVNFPGLDKWLIDSEQDGVGYRVTLGKEKLNEQNAMLFVAPFSEHEVFSITPVIAGAGGNVGASIGIGVGLIFASFLLPGAGLFGAGPGLLGITGSAGTVGALTTLGVALSGLGASLVLGGIAQAISPAPVMSSATNNPMERGRDAAKFESFTFSGIVNTAKQGLPVPIAYGRLFVGSAVLSSGLDVDQIL